MSHKPRRIRVDLAFENEDLRRPTFPSLIRHFDSLGRRLVPEPVRVHPGFLLLDPVDYLFDFRLSDDQKIRFQTLGQRPQIQWYRQPVTAAGERSESFSKMDDTPRYVVQLDPADDDGKRFQLLWSQPAEQAEAQIAYPFVVKVEGPAAEAGAPTAGGVLFAIANYRHRGRGTAGCQGAPHA